MYQRILVATDGSRLSAKAEQAGIELAAGLGAEVVAFSVAPKAPRSLLNPIVVASGMDQAKLDAWWTDQARSKAEKVAEKARKRGVTAIMASASSTNVAEAIIAHARKSRCDLIVMASHGRRGTERLLLGSETQNVLVQSRIPVLVVR